MSKGALSSVFVVGNDNLVRGKDTENLKYSTVSQKDPYISEDDATDLFDVYCEYLVKTNYAVCLTATMDSRVKEVLEALQEG